MRRTLGIVKPSTRPGRAEDLMAILPAGITLLHDQLNIHDGSQRELHDALPIYDAKLLAMAREGAQLLHPAGAPPLMLGYEGEQARIRAWEALCGVPVFTNGSSQVNAARALGAKKLLGFSYFREPEVNGQFRRYLEGAGFAVAGMSGLDVAFQQVPRVPEADIRAFIEPQLARHSVDAVYIVGPALKTIGLVDEWERRFGIPFVHHLPAQSWEIQRRFGLRQPVAGMGRLLSELPPL